MHFLKPRTLLSCAAALFIGFTTNAQLEYGGEPFAWEDKSSSRASTIEWYTTEALDMALIEAQDAVTDPMKDVPYRFGWEWEVALSTETAGTWTELSNGDRVWQLGVECPDATSISFIFDRYILPKGANLYIWNADRTRFKGAYTHKNNQEWESLGVGLIYDNKVVIELHEPAVVAGQTELSLGTIVHGYRSVLRSEETADRGPFGSSGACNININCPEGSDWQVEKRSVALIVSGGFATCSGALVNNTAQDGTPYFLTANHCLGGQNNWVFYFNHESPNCTSNTGPTNQSISGSILRASNAASDVALLELSDTPPASFNAQYAGWDHSDATTVTSAVGIHHPSGDVKKICFEDNSPFHQNVAGAACWYINQWEDGVTEGGSSGSPLFDQNHRIIGQLYGGFAACAGQNNNGQADWYGRFGVSWDNGSSSSTRLRDWLDPNNTGVTVLDGWPDGFVAADYDAAAGAIGNASGTICGNLAYPTVTVVNNGTVTLTSVTITVTLNGTVVATVPWTGSLNQGQSTQVNLPAVTVANGSNNLQVALSNPNGQTDENSNNNSVSASFNAVTGPTTEFELNLILDDYGTETTWTITPQGSNQVLFSGGPYQDDADGTLVNALFCLPDGCYTFTIDDEFGDGICCGYGDGSWSIVSWNSIEMGNGGEFEDSESLTFCTDAVGVGETVGSDVRIYPNPANATAMIEVPANSVELQVFDASGRLVVSQATNAQTLMVLNTSVLSSGRYTVRVIGSETVYTTPLVIRH